MSVQCIMLILLFFSAIERLRNFCRVFLWTNTTLKDTYLCFRVISSSCCIGIARAFMGAGARSVVVSLWAVEDKVTLEFMKCFYQHLAEGKPASESLNLAMKNLRESDEFRDIKYWAPFLLIGDDVSLDFMP